MAAAPQQDITGLLQAWRRGDRAALDQLAPLVHAQLHRLAHQYLVRERPGHVLQTSALVNEAYLRLIAAGDLDWRDRAHFLAVSAGIMRRVLIEYARVRDARKRGGGAVTICFDEEVVASPQRDADLIALDDALEDLAKTDPRQARIVELRFFGGLTEQETAYVLDVNERTVRREWAHAKSWLVREVRRGARS